MLRRDDEENGIQWESPLFGKLQILGKHFLAALTVSGISVLVYATIVHETSAKERELDMAAALREIAQAVREMNCLTRMQTQRAGKLLPEEAALCRTMSMGR